MKESRKYDEYMTSFACHTESFFYNACDIEEVEMFRPHKEYFIEDFV